MAHPKTRTILTAVLLAASLAPAARAADRVWFGGLPPGFGDGISFNDPDNWSPSGVPGSSDRALFLLGLADEVVFPGSLSLGHVRVANGSDIELTIPITQTVTLNGIGAEPEIIIGQDTSDPFGRLILSNGTLRAPVIKLGNDSASISDSELIVRSTGRLDFDLLQAGLSDRVTAKFENNSFGGRVEIGNADVIVEGALLELDSLDSVHIDGFSSSSLTVQQDGLLWARSMDIDTGHLRVTGAGSVAELDGTLRVSDDDGHGEVFIENGGVLRPRTDTTGALDIELGALNGITNEFIVRGNGSLLRADDVLVGVNGRLDIDDGGSVQLLTGTDTDVLTVDGGGDVRVLNGTLWVDGLIMKPGADVRLTAGEMWINGGPFEVNTDFIFDGISPASPPTLRLDNLADGESDGDFYVCNVVGRHGKMIVEAGASLAPEGGGTFIVGNGGGGVLEMTDASVVAYDDVHVADNGGTGSATISDALTAADSDRTLLDANVNLYVGADGDGELHVLDGALARATGDVRVGALAGGNGHVTVEGSENGAPAEVRAGDDLLIGVTFAGFDAGSGSVTLRGGGLVDVADEVHVGPNDGLIMEGGELHTRSLRVDNANPFGFRFENGVITVDGGTVSLASDNLAAEGGTFGDFPLWTLQNGASSSTQFLTAGFTFDGSIFVGSGSTVVADSGRVGAAAGVFGSLDVVGAGTHVDLETLDIGNDGFGFVVVADGASLFVSDQVWLGQSNGDGNMILSSGGELFVESNLTIGGFGLGASGTGMLSVGGSEVSVVDALVMHDGGALDVDDTSAIVVTELQPAGLLRFTLDDPAAADPAGIVRSFNAVTLGGTLEVAAGLAFAPVAGMEWTLVAAPSISGAFDAFVLPSVPNADVVIDTGDGQRVVARIEPQLDGDFDLDGMVAVGDLLTLLAGWGACPADGPCPGDLDGNGEIGVTDLLILLANWG